MEESNLENPILSNASMEIFDKCNKLMLIRFVMARRIDITKTKLPSKGKLADTINGEKNLIRLVFKFRELKNLLAEKLKLVENTNDELDEEIGHNLLNRFSVEINLSNDSLLTMKLSDLLFNEEWVTKVWNFFDNSSKPLNINQTSDELEERSIVSSNILISRLDNHINKRMYDEKKRDRWYLQWAKKKNLAQMAAIMILLDHIKSDLNCLDKTSTSLNSF